MSDHEQQAATFLARFETLRTQIETAAPGYEQLLLLIHKQLAADENMLHILSDEQVGVIVAGLSKRKNVVIAESSKTKAGTSTAKKVTKDLSDFM
jgi:hypothetical protein